MSNLIITATPTIDTNIYASGDVLGTTISVTSAELRDSSVSILQGISVTDISNQNAAIDFMFFNAALTGGTYTNNAALVLSEADKRAFLKLVSVTSYNTVSSSGFAQAEGINLPVEVSAQLSILAIVKATPTYLAANNLVFKFHFFA